MSTMPAETAATIRRIRDLLPPEAFQPNRRRLWAAALHSVIIVGGYATIRRMPALGPLMSLVIGHSLACLAFVAHELSHNAVVRSRTAKHAISMWALGINMIPPTMWNRLHNDTHHRHASTPADPDRPFLASERRLSTRAYAAAFYPSRDIWSGNVLVFAHFVSYIARNLFAVFYPGESKPSIMTSKPDYRAHERLRIGGELVGVVALQYVVWRAVGGSWVNYLWASPVALCLASAVIMAYVFTNHFLNPITHEHDPLSGTTSVVVPPIVDKIHGNFSFHTEHHLFPSLNSDYYPLVSRMLQQEAGDRYHRLPMVEAWRRLWTMERFR
ncbi:MAG: fatty acid desaturase [Acidobacteria bacterium]|nr:fatty acid desaturase [Acidobacteriota bacterium]